MTIVLGLLSCNDHTEKKIENRLFSNNDSLSTQSKETKQSSQTITPIESVHIDSSKIECMPTTYRYGNSWTNFSPGTFGITTYLFNSTNSNAKIIDTFKFNTSVNILSENGDFFLICSPKAKAGYVKKTDLYLHALFWGLKSYTYLFGINKYGTNDNIDCKTSILKVVKTNKDNALVDIYIDSIRGKNYEIKQCYNSALKNSEALFYLNYYCGNEMTTITDHFLVDNGNKLSRLIITSTSGEGGQADISTVYLPVRLTNGKKIVLAKNGVLAINEMTAKAEIYSYPPNSGIPIDELIVVENKSVEMLWDEDKGELKRNNDGTMAENITNVVTNFYQWNGTTIRKIKTIMGK